MMKRSASQQQMMISRLAFVFLLSVLVRASMAVETANEIQGLPILDSFLKIEESFDNSAEQTSLEVLTAPTTADFAPTNSLEELRANRRYPIEILNDSPKKEAKAVLTLLLKKTEDYLTWYRDKWPNAPGINKVKPAHLNLKLLKYRRVPVNDSNRKDRKEFTIIFDDEFHRHVRTRGLQLKLIESNRFPLIMYTAVATFAVLLLLYGILKLVNGRTEHDDHLSTSQISLV